MDEWHGGLRQFLKGWGNNLRGEYKREKEKLLKKIEEIDRKAKSDAIDEESTQRRL